MCCITLTCFIPSIASTSKILITLVLTPLYSHTQKTIYSMYFYLRKFEHKIQISVADENRQMGEKKKFSALNDLSESAGYEYCSSCTGSRAEICVSLSCLAGALVILLTRGWGCTEKAKPMQLVVNEVCSANWQP